MNSEKKAEWIMLSVLTVVLLMMMACSLSSGPGTTPEETPTPTPTVITGHAEPTPVASRCVGLSGTFELQLLVGPSDAVGLDPDAIGNIPFTIEGAGEPYALQGGANITYEDVLQKQWGTYTVSFNMDVTLTGTCSGEAGSEMLNVHVMMSGDQLVEVKAEGFQGEYPWSGTQETDLSFPLEEGVSAEGEGWALVLHLN